MTIMQAFIILCGLSAVLYGILTSRQILSLNPGNDKMQEIARAIQEGAKAYLNRQYLTISIVGIIIFILIWLIFDLYSAVGFLIGSFLSGAAGYVGMNISVRSNVRTTQAASSSLAEGLSVADFSAFAVLVEVFSAAETFFAESEVAFAESELFDALSFVLGSDL